MSGGVAYVLDGDGGFASRCNEQMVAVGATPQEELFVIRRMIERHAELTSSALARRILAGFAQAAPEFVRVMPNDYSRALDAHAKIRAAGMSPEPAEMAALAVNGR